ncbi:hypothetical protein [Aquimarina longa]|uniref:hypothetical protein n=1 Tax=Aquimarina longa TaxID=1080221 RepID=UPI000780DBB5|nr:hypothetical protein [Aquimarina longa]
MELLQVVRAVFFWLFDTLKGSKIKKEYSDIKKILENSGSLEYETKKNKYLKAILSHATTSTSYYQKYAEFKSIDDFPVINKNLIKHNFESFRSSKYLKKSCVKVSTSGSTGAPFMIMQDKHKRCRNTSDNLYFSNKAGYKIGQRLIYIKIWPENYKPNILSPLWWKNIIPQSVFQLSDSDIKRFLDELKNDSNHKSFIGYSSAYEKICRYLDATKSEKIDAKVDSIITISETLNEYTRNALKKYFGVSPLSRYSNNENGIIAQEDFVRKKSFLINSASYYVEIFDLNKDVLIQNGKLGRIVITDLYNYAMPLIRYDTGDVGIMEVDENNAPYLSRIGGRKLDLIYNTKGEIIPSHVSYKLFKYGDFRQFQLVQHGQKEYMIKLNTDKKVNEEKMLEEFMSYFGKDAIITIKYVNEIPLLSSGKRREVSNTYHTV